jgi:phosphonate transport system substrate-binding protein
MKTPSLKAAALIAVTALALFNSPANAVSKSKAVAAAGKPCSAANVGTPAQSASGSLDCVKEGAKFVWRASKPPTTSAAPAAPVTVATTTASPTTEAAKSQKWPDKIVFAPVPSENATQALITWGPFVKALEKEVGIKVEQVNPSDYAGVIEAQLNGKVDLAMYGPFSYYLAKTAGAKIEPVAVQISAIGANPSYKSYLVVPNNSSISSINDLKGKKVCFVDPGSTSGYLYPLEGLKSAGLSEKDYTAVFAGGHDKSVIAAKGGSCDAGFVYDDMFDKLLIERGLLKTNEMKVVWRSKSIPNSPIAVRTDLPDTLVAKIKEAVPKIDSLYLQANGLCPSNNQRCDFGGLAAWIPVKDDFFQAIVDVCKATNAAACQPAKKR